MCGFCWYSLMLRAWNSGQSLMYTIVIEAMRLEKAERELSDVSKKISVMLSQRELEFRIDSM